MDEFETPNFDALAGVVRGLIIGTLSVAAVAVWAVNLEVLLFQQPSAFDVIVRLLLCDAIPLAVLIVLHRGLGSEQSLERMIRRAVGSMFWFVARLAPHTASLDDPIDRATL